jgi:hypothetical protein
MPSVTFFLSIDASELQKYYRGEVLSVLATTQQGIKVQFPANLILPYVSHNGIHGRFILDYQPDGKAISLRRL